MKKALAHTALIALLSSSSVWADGIVLGTIKDDADLIKGVNRCKAMVDTLKEAEPPRNLEALFHIQAVMAYLGDNPASYEQGKEITQRVLEAGNPVALEQMIATCHKRSGAVLHELAMLKAHEMSDKAQELVKGF